MSQSKDFCTHFPLLDHCLFLEEKLFVHFEVIVRLFLHDYTQIRELLDEVFLRETETSTGLVLLFQTVQVRLGLALEINLVDFLEQILAFFGFGKLKALLPLVSAESKSASREVEFLFILLSQIELPWRIVLFVEVFEVMVVLGDVYYVSLGLALILRKHFLLPIPFIYWI